MVAQICSPRLYKLIPFICGSFLTISWGNSVGAIEAPWHGSAEQGQQKEREEISLQKMATLAVISEEKVSHLTVSSPAKVDDWVQLLLPHPNSLPEMLKLRHFIKAIPLAKRTDVLTRAYTLCKQKNIKAHLDRLLKAIYETASFDRDQILSYAQALIGEGAAGQDCEEIINMVRKTSVADRPAVIASLGPLLRENISLKMFLEPLVQTIAVIPESRRSDYISYAIALKPHDQAKGIISLLKTLLKISKFHPNADLSMTVKNLDKIAQGSTGTSLAVMVYVLSCMEAQVQDLFCSVLIENGEKGCCDASFAIYALLPVDYLGAFITQWRTAVRELVCQGSVADYFFSQINKDETFRNLIFDYWQTLLSTSEGHRGFLVAAFIHSALEELALTPDHPITLQAAVQLKQSEPIE
ncbi:hypothetical protein [Candidatus Odyssella thessalonicensis]|uniref:hypothetical protein n=1 Tax=Candidatus Odyssella thessalonicensis TaxID=84647 RepID=UPI000225B92F|nr:hypothetical protein [Candidatus Odyssella thessalonicensis]